MTSREIWVGDRNSTSSDATFWKGVMQGTCYHFMITQELFFLNVNMDCFINTGESGLLFKLHMHVHMYSVFANWLEFCKCSLLNPPISFTSWCFSWTQNQEMNPLEKKAQSLSKIKGKISAYICKQHSDFLHYKHVECSGLQPGDFLCMSWGKK